MSEVNKVSYTAKTHSTGGRDGTSRSSDGHLDVELASPGTAGSYQFRAAVRARWSTCLEGAAMRCFTYAGGQANRRSWPTINLELIEGFQVFAAEA
jgi:hypothetical protein